MQLTVVVIGFERNQYIAAESVGELEVCAVVIIPPPEVDILDVIVLTLVTIEGTAGECKPAWCNHIIMYMYCYSQV